MTQHSLERTTHSYITLPVTFKEHYPFIIKLALAAAVQFYIEHTAQELVHVQHMYRNYSKCILEGSRDTYNRNIKKVVKIECLISTIDCHRS